MSSVAQEAEAVGQDSENSQVRCLMLAILVTLEAEIGRITVEGQRWQKVSDSPCQ
jgi:hypothetical protein